MAIRRITGRGDLPVYFDVSHRVGPSSQNDRDDVMLVQYLMKKTYQAMGPEARPAGVAPGRDPGGRPVQLPRHVHNPALPVLVRLLGSGWTH